MKAEQMMAELEEQQNPTKQPKLMRIKAYGPIACGTYGWSDINAVTAGISKTVYAQGAARKCYYATLLGHSVSDYVSLTNEKHRDDLREIIGRMDNHQGTDKDLATLAFYAKQDGMRVEVE
jgi:hypothetical protein